MMRHHKGYGGCNCPCHHPGRVMLHCVPCCYPSDESKAETKSKPTKGEPISPVAAPLLKSSPKQQKQPESETRRLVKVWLMLSALNFLVAFIFEQLGFPWRHVFSNIELLVYLIGGAVTLPFWEGIRIAQEERQRIALEKKKGINTAQTENPMIQLLHRGMWLWLSITFAAVCCVIAMPAKAETYQVSPDEVKFSCLNAVYAQLNKQFGAGKPFEFKAHDVKVLPLENQAKGTASNHGYACMLVGVLVTPTDKKSGVIQNKLFSAVTDDTVSTWKVDELSWPKVRSTH